MITILKTWGKRYLSDPQAVLFLGLLGVGLFLILGMGKILAPVFASIVLAYLLQWVANILVRCGCPARAAVFVVYIAFLSLFLLAIFVLWPIIFQQFLRLFDEVPNMLTHVQEFLYLLPQKFPQYLTQETVDGWVSGFMLQAKQGAKAFLTFSLASLPNVMAVIIYLILVPLMVFFFLKDHQEITDWCMKFLPRRREFLRELWQDVHAQIGNYIRGKGAEVAIVALITYLVFYFCHLRYAVLLAVLVGLSVLVPYVGIVVVTIPVVLVAFFQWGFESQFLYLLIAYGIVQALDGAILVPLLFAEAVSLHPVVIIIAVLVFGGWWGFWGVFFAIPLAAFVNAVIQRWPVAT